MIHHKVWFWLEEINDAIVPGPGQLIGFDVKRDFVSPVDFIPFVGPLGKLHKLTKLVKQGHKVKPLVRKFVFWGINIAGDIYAAKESVEWYNARYRYSAEIIEDEIAEEESSSPSRSGNADEEISGGGGTKKKPPTRKSSRKAPWISRPRCRKRNRSGKLCRLGRGHRGRHQFK